MGFVPPSIPSNPSMVLVGQGPGQQEAFNSKPFFHMAPIGERLNKWLYRSGISRTKIAIGNLVQCWLPEHKTKGPAQGNRAPTTDEARWCWNAHVGPWIHATSDDAVIVPVGVPATKFILGIDPDKGAEKFLGTLNRVTIPPIGENHAGTDSDGESGGSDSGS